MKIVTGKVRASFLNVFTKRMNDLSGKEEYSMMLLIPKKDIETIAKINKAVESAIEEKWGTKRPNGLRLPLRDGDAEKGGEGCYKGVMFMSVKASSKPGVVDANLEPIIDPSEFVSGDWCRVSLNSFAYDKQVNKGVSFGLNNVQMLCKGEPLSGRARPEDEFQVVPSEKTEEWG